MPSSDGAKGHDLTPQDFEAIRDAVMETPRGRWFLSEYANRLRSAETTGLLDSMKRLENAVSSNHEQLMARLAQALVRDAAPPSAPVPQADLAPKHMKFFKQDEEIFEPAPQAKIAAVPDVKKPEPRPDIPRGAKVVIRRATDTSIAIESPPAAPPAPPVAEVAPPPPPPPPLSEPQPQAQADAPKRRIVIIRHKPGEQIDVPLTDDVAKAS